MLKESSNDELEAFWHIIVAGYPVCFAKKHHKTLCNYLKDHPYTYAESLMKIIESKAKGKKVSKPAMKVVHSKTADLMEQLKASLAGTKTKKAS